MNFKLDQNNLPTIVNDIASFNKEEYDVFIQMHKIYFADKYPSKTEITNAFMQRNIVVGFTYEHSSTDSVFRLVFRQYNKNIHNWNPTLATK